MTAPLLGLRPSIRLEDVDVGLPSDHGLTPDHLLDLGKCELLLLNISLTKINGRILDNVAQLRVKDYEDYEAKIQASLSELEQWRSNIPPRYGGDWALGIPPAVHEMGEMRSLASLFLRYHQVRQESHAVQMMNLG